MNRLRKLRIRVKHGVKEELIPLVKLEGVGRIRARKLFNAGLKNLGKLRKIPVESLAKLIGEKTAVKIKRQLEGRKKEEIQTLLK